MNLLYAHSVKAVSSGVSCCPRRAVSDPSFSALAESTRRRRELEGSPLGTGQLCGQLCHHDIMCN